MKRAGISDDDTTHLLAHAPQQGEVGGELSHFPRTMRLRALEEGIRLPPVKTENFTRLRVSDFAGAIGLCDKRLDCPAGETGGVSTQRLHQRVWQ